MQEGARDVPKHEIQCDEKTEEGPQVQRAERVVDGPHIQLQEQATREPSASVRRPPP